MKNDEKRLEGIISILANAFELQPEYSTITGELRRKHKQKGTHRDYVIKALRKKEKKDTDILQSVLKGFVQYPEILRSLTDSILRKEEVDHFYFFKTFFDCFPKGYEAAQMEKVIVDHLHNPELGYHCLRDIAKIAGIRGKHPALRMPPVTVTVNQLAVPIYLLTRYQIGVLMGKSSYKTDDPLRPYTISSIEEVPEILQRLSDRTNQRWRLPLVHEWLSIAGVSELNRWPWGEGEPQYKIHAHLRYIDQGGNVAPHPLEVGIFPKGKSRTELFDLIGNTYELVIGDDGRYRLAGGAWTTNFKAGSDFPMIRRWREGKNNIGLRPVCENY